MDTEYSLSDAWTFVKCQQEELFSHQVCGLWKDEKQILIANIWRDCIVKVKEPCLHHQAPALCTGTADDLIGDKRKKENNTDLPLESYTAWWKKS